MQSSTLGEGSVGKGSWLFHHRDPTHMLWWLSLTSTRCSVIHYADGRM